MLDGIKAECMSELFTVERTKPYVAFGKVFYPLWNREGKYIYHHSLVENLVAKINLQGKLTIENSLHKFWHGNNFTDFTLSEIQTSISQIENIFKISSNEFLLKKVEAGLNVTADEQFHNRFQQYKMNGFENMRKGKIVYGRKFYLTDFNIKVYNKYLETNLNPNSVKFDNTGNPIPINLNRFEIEFKRMRELNDCGLIMLSDATNREVMMNVVSKLLKKYNDIEMDGKYNYNILSSRERELFYAGKDTEFWNLEKEKNKNTYKEKRVKYKSCLKRLDSQLQNNPKELMLKTLSDKANYLLSN